RFLFYIKGMGKKKEKTRRKGRRDSSPSCWQLAASAQGEVVTKRGNHRVKDDYPGYIRKDDFKSESNIEAAGLPLFP
ncbi:hypothetical protein, partial [Aeromonas sp. R4-3]|uniref:hypothetical protein n=1 Tax=Aeromonas sp. R4-3 TaxID=3138466 RepID=UPI0034A446B9